MIVFSHETVGQLTRKLHRLTRKSQEYVGLIAPSHSFKKLNCVQVNSVLFQPKIQLNKPRIYSSTNRKLWFPKKFSTWTDIFRSIELRLWFVEFKLWFYRIEVRSICSNEGLNRIPSTELFGPCNRGFFSPCTTPSHPLVSNGRCWFWPRKLFAPENLKFKRVTGTNFQSRARIRDAHSHNHK